jgi:drug/metabolite transporter (DMT)-like permease
MFRSNALARPGKVSLWLTLTVAIFTFYGSQASASLGYLCALLCLVAMIFASSLNSFWPTGRKAENPLVFAMFWGSLIGVVFPFLLQTFFDKGLQGVFEVFAS